MLILALAVASGLLLAFGWPVTYPWLTDAVVAVLTSVTRPANELVALVYQVADLDDTSATAAAAILLAPGLVALAASGAAIAGSTIRKIAGVVSAGAALASYAWLPAGTATIALVVLGMIATAFVVGGRLVLVFPFAVIVVTLTLTTFGTLFPGIIVPQLDLATIVGSELHLDLLSNIEYVVVSGLSLLPYLGASVLLLKATR